MHKESQPDIMSRLKNQSRLNWKQGKAQFIPYDMPLTNTPLKLALGRLDAPNCL